MSSPLTPTFRPFHVTPSQLNVRQAHLYHCQVWGWDMVFFLATCSVVYGMRVGDAGQGESTAGVRTPQKGMGGIPFG